MAAAHGAGEDNWADGAEDAGEWSARARTTGVTETSRRAERAGEDDWADGELSSAPTKSSQTTCSNDEVASTAPARSEAHVGDDRTASEAGGGSDVADWDDGSDEDCDDEGAEFDRDSDSTSVLLHVPDEPHPWLLADGETRAFIIRPRPVLARRLLSRKAGAGGPELLETEEGAFSFSALSSLFCKSMQLPDVSAPYFSGLTAVLPVTVSPVQPATWQGADGASCCRKGAARHDALPFRNEWEIRNLLQSPSLLDRAMSARTRWEETPRNTNTL
jgi:hypothetical protein